MNESSAPIAPPEDLVVVLCTVPDAETGDRLARQLVERRLAACVNRVPGLVSVYRWKGELCVDGEELLVIKTRAPLFDALAAAIDEAHPYDVPEVVALPMTACHAPYARWLAGATERDG